MNYDKGNILVVDDTPDNLRLLSVMLSENGYKVRKALNGLTAINTVKTVPPDLILLDINMPGMNGYEVCKTLKEEQKIDIPIIFISALDDVLDKVKAFNVGGVDYITKPFQVEEVIARLENQLTICRQKKQLQKEIEERLRAEEALQVYLHTVSHDLRNPVIGMSMIFKNLLKGHSSDSSSSETISMPVSVLVRMDNSCDRQLSLINSLVETQQFDIWGIPLECKSISLFDFSEELVKEWMPRFNDNNTIIENKISADLPLVKADINQLWRVFENLIANALKHNPPGIILTLNAERLETGNFLRCLIADNGVGIDEELGQFLFERYQRGKAAKRTKGLGLGLYLCRQIIEAHGGEIGVNTCPGEGCQFWFTLPIIELT